jgi:hypothetical protein
MAFINKDDIIEDVNENLGLNASDTDLDRQINKVLSDLSKKGLLIDTDDTQTLDDGDTTLNWPTGYRSTFNITLTDAGGTEREPLIKLPGGIKEYRQKIAHGSTAGIPRWFAEFEGKFYLWGTAGEAYTTLIEFRKNHPKDPNNIEFDTDFENVMFAGVTYWKAAALTRSNAVAIWKPIYDQEMKKVVLDRRNQPSLMRG